MKPQICGETGPHAPRPQPERPVARRLARPISPIQGSHRSAWATSRSDPGPRQDRPAGVHRPAPAEDQSIFQTDSDQYETRIPVAPGPVEPTDLRRRTRRDHALRLVEHARYLSVDDRELVEAVFGQGISVAAYVRRAADAGRLHRDCARVARRRLRRIVARISSPLFAFVLAHRTGWGTTRRRVAMACIVQGASLRDTARALGLSLHAVRRHMEAIDALYTETRRHTANRPGDTIGDHHDD